MKRLTLLGLLSLTLVLGAHGDVVINEVFGGGGNIGAPFNQDYVELFNNGATAVDIGGWTIQYQTATGTTFSLIAAIPTSTFLAAGDFYTVTAGPVPPGATGANVPNDQAGNNVAISTFSGKVFLFDNSPTPINIDLVGWGTNANQFEGAGPAPTMSNTTSIQRIANGFDSNNNSSDFRALSPTPEAFNVVPEPSTYAMIMVGAALLISGQRLRRKG